MIFRESADLLCQHCRKNCWSVGNGGGSSLTLTFLSQYSSATTSQEKLVKLGHKIGKNLDKTVKETMNYLESLFPCASEVKKP